MVTRKELEEAIEYCSVNRSGPIALIVEAARAHLETLPKTKAVEVEFWATMDSDGHAVRLWDSAYEAYKHATERGHQAVRLTGTATVPE